MALLVIDFTCLLALLFIIIIIRHRRLNRNALITNWPILGMLPGLFQNIPRLYDFVFEVLEKCSGNFEFKSLMFSNTDFFLTCDPLNYHHIFITNSANYPKGPEFREIFEAVGDGILGTDDGNLLKLQKKMFHLWNAQQSKKGFFTGVTHRKVVEDLIPFLDHVSHTGIQVDIQKVIENMITLDNAINLIFGFDLSSHEFKLPKAKYQRAIKDIQETMVRRHFVPAFLWKLQRWLQIGTERKYSKNREIFDQLLYDCLALTRRREKQQTTSDDMISIYLDNDNHQNSNPNPNYSDRFLRDVAFSFVAAAKDTFTSSLTWFFWLVATHPAVEAKILREIDEIPAKSPEEIIFSEEAMRNKLVYLQAALLETLRLYPSVPFNHKTAIAEDTLPSGHRIRAKQRVLMSFYSTGRMKEVWGEDCLEFKPERWIDYSKNGSDRLIYVPAHKFPAFNIGPRTCLGKDLGIVQAKIVVVNILRRFRLEVVNGHPIFPTLTITVHMKHGLMMNVYKR